MLEYIFENMRDLVTICSPQTRSDPACADKDRKRKRNIEDTGSNTTLNEHVLKSKLDVPVGPVFAKADRKLLIRVHECGKSGVQIEPFRQAQTNIHENDRDTYARVTFETINNDYIRKNRWSPKHMVDWLLESDIHFILSHVHQGMNVSIRTKYHSEWNCSHFNHSKQSFTSHLWTNITFSPT